MLTRGNHEKTMSELMEKALKEACSKNVRVKMTAIGNVFMTYSKFLTH